MIRIALSIALLAGALSGGPAGASHEPTTVYFSFRTTVPCGVACPYWTDTITTAHGCAKNPLAPPGSWDQRRITIPETYAGGVPVMLRLRIFPTVEYDAFICLVNDPGPNERWEIATTGVGFPTGGACTVADLGVGCVESLQVRVDPGQVFVLRAYNFSDGPICPAELTWGVV